MYWNAVDVTKQPKCFCSEAWFWNLKNEVFSSQLKKLEMISGIYNYWSIWWKKVREKEHETLTCWMPLIRYFCCIPTLADILFLETMRNYLWRRFILPVVTPTRSPRLATWNILEQKTTKQGTLVRELLKNSF